MRWQRTLTLQFCADPTFLDIKNKVTERGVTQVPVPCILPGEVFAGWCPTNTRDSVRLFQQKLLLRTKERRWVSKPVLLVF